tara:strand:+ start:1438 stop:2175 length:738 start_codon:yes stop_codon:yes gene_type:complete
MTILTERTATFNEICAIPVPEEDGRYMPVSNEYLSTAVIDCVKDVYSLTDDDLDITFGLSQSDQQMYGNIVVKNEALYNGKYDSGMSIAFRNSYNKSKAVGLAAGATCLICDNGQMSGDVVEMRKHTLNVFSHLDAMILRAVEGGGANFQKAMHHAEQLDGIELTKRRMAELTGLARYEGVLKPQQESVVLEQIKKSKHAEHDLPTAWGFHAHMTQAAKMGPAGNAITRHRKVQKFMEREFALAA